MNKPTLPKCADCRVGNPHAVSNGAGGHVWLCGDCEYARDHPDFVPMPKTPRERRAKPLQKERLFDL